MLFSANDEQLRSHLPRPALAKLGLWFDPVGFARRLLVWFFVSALPISLALSAGVAWWAQGHFKSSYGVSSILRIRPNMDPPAVLADMEPYRTPTFSPREIEAWFRAWPVLQEAYIASHRDDGIGVLRALTTVSYERDSGRLTLSYRGAASIDRALDTTTAMAEGVVAYGRQQIAQRVEGDLAIHRRRLLEAQQAALEDEARLTAFSAETGILDSEQALRLRSMAVMQSQEALDNAIRALANLDQRRKDLPGVIGQLPSEVPGSRSLIDERSRSLEALRERLRSMRAKYAPTNPILLQAEDELRNAETVALSDIFPQKAQPDTMMRNPVLDDLAREKATLELDRPQLVAEIAYRTSALAAVTAKRDELPAQIETFNRLQDAVTSSRALLKRLDARLIEINMIRDRVQSPIEIIEAPHDGAVSESTRFKKVGIVSGAAFMAAAGFFSAIILYLLWRDTRVRSAADARYAFLTTGAMGAPRAGNPGPWSRRLCDHVTSAASSSMLVGSDLQAVGETAYQLAMASAAGGLRTLLVSVPSDHMVLPGECGDVVDVLAGSVRARDAVQTIADDLVWLPMLHGDHCFEDLAAYIPSGFVEALWNDLKKHTDVLIVAMPAMDGGLLRRSCKELDALVVVVDPSDRSAAEMGRRIRDLNQPVTAAVVATYEELL